MKYIHTTLVLLVFNAFFAQEISVEKIWKKYEYRTQGIVGFNSLGDGDRYTQLDDQGNLVLAYISKPNEAPSVLIDANALTYKGKQVIIEDYSFDKSERKVLIMTSINPIYRRSYSAVYYLYDFEKGKTLSLLSPDEWNKRELYIGAFTLTSENKWLKK
jgi:dipeptidyl-peptidase-4